MIAQEASAVLIEFIHVVKVVNAFTLIDSYLCCIVTQKKHKNPLAENADCNQLAPRRRDTSKTKDVSGRVV